MKAALRPIGQRSLYTLREVADLLRLDYKTVQRNRERLFPHAFRSGVEVGAWRVPRCCLTAAGREHEDGWNRQDRRAGLAVVR